MGVYDQSQKVVTMKPLWLPVKYFEETKVNNIQDEPGDKILTLEVSEVVKKPMFHFYQSRQ